MAFPFSPAFVGRFLGDLQDAVPITSLLAVGVAQEVKRPFACGIDRQGLLEKLRPQLDVLVARDPARPEAERELGALHSVRKLVDELALDGDEAIGSAALDEHPLKEGRGLLGVRIGAVCSLEQLLDFLGCEAPRDACRAQEESRSELGVDGVARLAEELRDVRLPRTALGLDVLEAGGRFLVHAAAIATALAYVLVALS